MPTTTDRPCWRLTLLTGVLMLSLMGTAAAETRVHQGLLASDDALAVVDFELLAEDLFSVRSLSFAGGRTGLGTAVAAGGFAPVLTLFDLGSGGLVTGDRGSAHSAGNCIGAADAATGFCWDAGFSHTLTAGRYRLVLSQDGNDPLGGLADGFSQQGQADYTAAYGGLAGGAMFVAVNGQQRDGHWALAFSADQLAPVPEPTQAWLLAAGLGWLVSLAGWPGGTARRSARS